MQVFQAVQHADPVRTASCIRTLAMHVDTANFSTNDKNTVVLATQYVYARANPQLQYEAGIVLKQLGAPLPAVIQKTTTTSVSSAPAQSSYTADTCNKSAVRDAKKYTRAGHRHHRKGRYKKAVRQYKRALKRCNSYLPGIYRMAAAQAAEGNNIECNTYLNQLRQIDSPEANEKLLTARGSDDFQGMRNDETFRGLTGYVRIRLLNAIGKMGRDEVKRIEKYLKKLNYAVGEIGMDRRDKPAPYPEIWYKPSAKRQALIARELVDHPKTRINGNLKPDYPYDVVISWSVKLVKNQYDELQPESVAHKIDPDNIDAELRSIEQKEDEVLRKPTRAFNKADRVLGTPDRIGSSIENSTNKVERVIDRVPGF